jgi:hypothetical protein
MMQKFLITAWSVWAGVGRTLGPGCLAGLRELVGLLELVDDTHVRFGLLAAWVFHDPMSGGVPRLRCGRLAV